MQHEAILDLIDGMASELQSRLQAAGRDNPLIIGIHTGGAWIAERLRQRLAIDEPIGTLDISFYRDDYTRIGMNPQVRPSNIPFEVEDRHIVLVDDVIQSGRTIRAAANEIFDYGRPASLNLAVLIERDGRELPIQPDVIGLHPSLNTDERITLTGPEPLALVTGHSNQSNRQAQGGN